MPSNLRRYKQTADLHFITFSCYRRQPKPGSPSVRTQFERSLEQTRCAYGLSVSGYVVMPEHVHLLVTEPEKALLATALQALKQSVSRTLTLRHTQAFWQARYYDFNVRSEKKRVEKLRFMHRNPIVRGLVAKPEDWPVAQLPARYHRGRGCDRKSNRNGPPPCGNAWGFGPSVPCNLWFSSPALAKLGRSTQIRGTNVKPESSGATRL
jgi:putative transposase